jgi:hypothetical protein
VKVWKAVQEGRCSSCGSVVSEGQQFTREVWGAGCAGRAARGKGCDGADGLVRRPMGFRLAACGGGRLGFWFVGLPLPRQLLVQSQVFAVLLLAGSVDFDLRRSGAEGEKDGAVVTSYRHRCAVRGKCLAPVAERRRQSRPVRLRQVAFGEMKRGWGGALQARNGLERNVDRWRQRTYTPYSCPSKPRKRIVPCVNRHSFPSVGTLDR